MRMIACSRHFTIVSPRLACALSIATLALCASACSKPSTQSATSTTADTVREVRGHDFPELIVDASAAKTSEGATASDSDTDFCASLRAKTVAELDAVWRPVVENIRFTCVYDDETHVTTARAVARLRDGAATMFGVPVLEIGRDLSDFGARDEYVLRGSIQTQGKTLIENIRKHCLTRNDLDCGDALGDAKDGYYLQTGEASGIRLDPGESDSQKLVYAEMFGA